MKQKVLLGMSGGLDSSVSAYLLQRQGYEVTGVTMRLRSRELDPSGAQDRDIEDARKVCEVLKIPHLELDFTERFTQSVIDYFIGEYYSGRTPNPCIACNKSLKFGLLLDYALENEFDFVSTGHYARVEYSEALGRWLLYRVPSKKDQSYVLYHLTQRQLSHVLFPMLSLEKTEARRLAQEAGLPVAQKPDSQDICFIRDGDYISFLERYTKKSAPRGAFVSPEGTVLGEHLGITRYTIGQRKGLGAAFGKPMYVTRINAAENSITLGEEGSQYTSSFLARDTSFVPFDFLSKELSVQVKVRYQAPPVPARLFPLAGGQVRVELDAPQRSVTPGQAAVFYQDDLVVGGGTIV